MPTTMHICTYIYIYTYLCDLKICWQGFKEKAESHARGSPNNPRAPPIRKGGQRRATSTDEPAANSYSTSCWIWVSRVLPTNQTATLPSDGIVLSSLFRIDLVMNKCHAVLQQIKSLRIISSISNPVKSPTKSNVLFQYISMIYLLWLNLARTFHACWSATSLNCR
jgi:hypothetical protein